MKLNDLSLLRSYSDSNILSEEDKFKATVLGHKVERMPKWVQSRVSSKEGLGGYWYPILQGEPGIHEKNNFAVATFHPPETEAQHLDLQGLINREDVMMAYVDTGKLHIVFSDFRLEDRGLEVWFQEDEFNDEGQLIGASSYKTVKRLKTIDRRVRVHIYLGQLRVLIVDGDPIYDGKDLDGAGAVSREVMDMAISRAEMGFWLPAQEASMRNNLDKEHVFNGRFVGGPNIDVAGTLGDVGAHFEGFTKGNFTVRDDMPEVNGYQVDVITHRENIKKEVKGCNGVWGVFEPQSKKNAYEDQQHLLNNPFLLRKPQIRETMQYSSDMHLAKLKAGESLDSAEKILSAEQNIKYSWDETRYTRMYRWVGSNLRLHFPDGMAPELWSRWFTYQLGHSWIASCGLTNPTRWQKSARIPIPHAYRAQMMSQAFINIVHGDEDFTVEDNQIRYHEGTDTFVVSTSDWVNTVIPSHGGCDMDDFFVLRWVNNLGELAVVATRNPLTRGEYTIWQPYPGDPIPDVGEDQDLSTVKFPELKKLRPKQIKAAQEDGDVTIKDLPSKGCDSSNAEVRKYRKADVRRDLNWLMQADDSTYGSIELAVRVWNSLSPTKHHPEQYGSEDMVDAFTQAGAIEDQKVALEYAERLVQEVKDSGKNIDPYLGGDEELGLKNRLGIEGIPTAKSGPMFDIKEEMMANIVRFDDDNGNGLLSDFCRSLPKPKFLNYYHRNHALWAECVEKLGETRRKQRETMNSTKDSRKEQEKIILPWLDNIRETKGASAWAEYVLTLWAVTWEIPKKDKFNTITDQLIFGTSVHEHWFEAMRYYGFALHPSVSDEGQIIYLDRDVEFDFNENYWIGHCQECEETFELKSLENFNRFKHMEGICSSCRESKVS